MNDPNGLIKIGDVFHLFYQHNPTHATWGNIHWGHATSTDLIRWEYQPIALAPDELGLIFSGTVVIDDADTAGFGARAMVAVFTHDLDGRQRQSLAFSTDGGTGWSKYLGNPVLEGPETARDYRDPKVLRFRSNGDSWWVMALAVGPSIWFYRSDNLISWKLTSKLAVPSPWQGGVVEVAELVRVPTAGSNETHWTLMWSVHLPSEGLTARNVWWSRGGFDGEAFVPVGLPQRFDAGTDLYAVMAWDTDLETPICIGWMNDQRATTDPRRSWCGRLSLARRVAYRSAEGGLHLTQHPILPTLPTTQHPRPVSVDQVIDIRSSSFAIELKMPIPDGLDETRLVVEDTDSGDELAGIVVSSNGCHARLADSVAVPIGRPLFSDAELDVTIVIDRGSMELFADDGRVAASVVTDRDSASVRLRVESEASWVYTVRLSDFETLTLDWDDRNAATRA